MNLSSLKKATDTVDSRNQLKNSDNAIFENLDSNGIKVLFVGNSISLHGPKADIGWHGNWGMAASAKDKDYVHIIEKHILALDKNASFCICNVADWESMYKTGEETFKFYKNARNFDADVIIVKLSANSPIDNFDETRYKESFTALVNYFNKSGKAKIVVATDFFHHPAEAALSAYCCENGLELCVLSDLGDMPEMKALGLFEHEGVANHPGDLGMKTIACRILKALYGN